MNKPQPRQAIRDLFRKKRRALSKEQQSAAAKSCADLVQQQSWFQQAESIAAYLAQDGELDPSCILSAALKCNKKCFLPLLQDKHLQFAQWYENTEMKINRFGIAEPQGTASSNPQQLDIILLPLVAFDKSGSRLGMGGGFYDRSLAFKLQGKSLGQQPQLGKASGQIAEAKTASNKPLLIGLAHSCQQAAELERQEWDVPLDYILTEKEILICG